MFSVPRQSRSRGRSDGLKMLYWLIPYLVAYSGNDSGQWKYGPEHVFRAEVYSNITIPTDSIAGYSEVFIDFTCRPMNTSVIQCRTESTTMDKWEVTIGTSTKKESAHYDDIGIDNIVFQIQFDEAGITRVWFVNDDRSMKQNMIRAIIGTMSAGLNLTGKKCTRYVFPEEAIIGTCTTSFNIGRWRLSEEELKPETMIEGYRFEVPALGRGTDNTTVIIHKERNVDDCAKKTPYFFGSTEEEDAKAGYKYEKHITYSVSKMHLGEEYFSSYTENLGVFYDDVPKKSGKFVKTKMEAGEKIRVSLQAIRPATEKLGSLKTGVGFEPGTPWPERDTE